MLLSTHASRVAVFPGDGAIYRERRLPRLWQGSPCPAAQLLEIDLPVEAEQVRASARHVGHRQTGLASALLYPRAH